MDRTGKKVATASEKGTVIRVFSIPEGKRLFEFRRGVARCATISSLNFSPEANFLSVSSNTQTIHIFKLVNVQEQVDEHSRADFNPFWRAQMKNQTVTGEAILREVFNQQRAISLLESVKFCSKAETLQRRNCILAGSRTSGEESSLIAEKTISNILAPFTRSGENTIFLWRAQMVTCMFTKSTRLVASVILSSNIR